MGWRDHPAAHVQTDGVASCQPPAAFDLKKESVHIHIAFGQVVQSAGDQSEEGFVVLELEDGIVADLGDSPQLKRPRLVDVRFVGAGFGVHTELVEEVQVQLALEDDMRVSG
jgi:hypothetical protein